MTINSWAIVAFVILYTIGLVAFHIIRRRQYKKDIELNESLNLHSSAPNRYMRSKK